MGLDSIIQAVGNYTFTVIFFPSFPYMAVITSPDPAGWSGWRTDPSRLGRPPSGAARS